MNLSENFDYIRQHVYDVGPIIMNNNGFVNQYYGDGIMAIFPDNPSDALQASIDMQNQLNGKEQKLGVEHIDTKVGVGIHTGNLMMGIIGDEYHNQPVTIADTVNIASRIESLTKFFGTKILLSQSSLDRITYPHNFDFRFLGKVQVKGRSKHIPIYECFNGDDEEIYLKKKNSLEQFQDGLKYYYSKDFPRATVVFRDILLLNPADSVSNHFLKKAAYFISNGVPEDWSGIEVMDSK